jgi:acyl dehydratase
MTPRAVQEQVFLAENRLLPDLRDAEQAGDLRVGEQIAHGFLTRARSGDQAGE